jgi:Domain of unknown function (DUF4389)
MRVGVPRPQRRATVFFRLILAIPQVIVLYFVGIAAGVVLIVGWFAALFTGRMPQSFADFLLGELRWRIRVAAYIYLLTDVYPPFTLSPDVNYPIDVAVQSGRLNRLAVLFRYFLAIPGSIAVALVSIGMYVFSIVTWVATLVKGETPRAMFEANAATLRFATRFAAYFYMLTSFYPSEVMGDEGSATLGTPTPPSFSPTPPGTGSTSPSTVAPPPPSWAPGGPPSAPPPDAPGSLPSLAGFEAPAEPVPSIPGSTVSPAPPPPPPPPAAEQFYPPSAGAVPHAPHQASTSAPVDPASTWRLVLSSGARKLVVAFFILGGVAAVIYAVVIISAVAGTTNNVEQRATAQTQVFSAFGALTSDVQTYKSATDTCNAGSAAVVVQCLEGADAQFGSALKGYSTALAGISFPSSVQPQVNDLQSTIATATSKVIGLSELGPTDAQAYNSAVNSVNIGSMFDQIQTDTQSLNSALIQG